MITSGYLFEFELKIQPIPSKRRTVNIKSNRQLADTYFITVNLLFPTLKLVQKIIKIKKIIIPIKYL